MSRTARIVAGVALLAALLGGSVLWQINDDERLDDFDKALTLAVDAQEASTASLSTSVDALTRARDANEKSAAAGRGVVRITRDVRAAGIKGDPGETVVGTDGARGLRGFDGSTIRGPAGESVTGPQGESITGQTGATGPEGPAGPPPTMQELLDAVAAYLSGKSFPCNPDPEVPGQLICSFP